MPILSPKRKAVRSTVLLPAAFCLLSSGAAFSARSADLPRGELIEKVPTLAQPDQSYALYLPSSYVEEGPWPILYCLDPGARGRVAAERFTEGAEKYGYIVAGSNNSRNGPIEPNLAAISAMWNDTHARFPIDPKRVFLAGMSGGARLACGVALEHGQFAGVIACAGGFPGLKLPKSIPFMFFGTAGTDDFNYPEMRRLDQELDEAGVPNKVVIFQGGHDWAPPALCTEAMEWLEVQSIRTGRRTRDQKLVDSLFDRAMASLRAKEATAQPGEAYFETAALVEAFQGLRDVSQLEKQAARLEGSKELKKLLKSEKSQEQRQEKITSELYEMWMGQQDIDRRQSLMASFSTTLEGIKRQAEGSTDSPGRRVARRALRGLYIRAYEDAQVLLRRKSYTEAARELELAGAIRSDGAPLLYEIASAHGMDHNRRRCMEYLEKATAKGFKDYGRLEQDPGFAFIRSDPGFRTMIDRIRANAAK